MINVKYKVDGDWIDDDGEFLLLDQAKAHAVSMNYAEYKAFDGDRVVAHLFNAVKPKPKAKKKTTKPLEEHTPVVEHVDVELDSPEEDY